MENPAHLTDHDLITAYGNAVDALRTAIREKRAWSEYKESVLRRDALYAELMRRLSK